MKTIKLKQLAVKGLASGKLRLGRVRHKPTGVYVFGKTMYGANVPVMMSELDYNKDFIELPDMWKSALSRGSVAMSKVMVDMHGQKVKVNAPDPSLSPEEVERLKDFDIDSISRKPPFIDYDVLSDVYANITMERIPTTEQDLATTAMNKFFNVKALQAIKRAAQQSWSKYFEDLKAKCRKCYI